MRNIISCTPWKVCDVINDINNKWDFIEHNISAAINKTVPKKIVKKGKSVPWMTKEIRKLCTRKKILYKRFKNSGSHVVEKQFKECSKMLKKAIKKSHRSYSLGISQTAKSNPKKFWNYVRSSTKEPSQLSFSTSDGDLTDPHAIACAFNNHFAGNFGTSSSVDLNSLPNSPPSHGGDCFSFDSFTVGEVVDSLIELDASKSPGPDGILPIFLKSCAHELAPALCCFFNDCISKGDIPSAWKRANVVPIYKGSGKPRNDISSYRPVSLTSILCKVLERLICKRLLCYIDEHDILSDDQFGFRHGRSCEQMLAKFHHFLSGNLDNSKDCNLVDGIFLDFSSAFDRVDHRILLQKLHNYGLRGGVLKFIQSFLSERKQRVVVGGSYSNWVPVTSGVPQGSVLGPILFLLFVNDINEGLSSPLFRFADDHTAVRCIRSHRDRVVLQKDLDRIHDWTVVNNLPLNASKCAVVHFSRSKAFGPVTTYFLGGVPIKVVDNFKLLGIVFSSSLSFSSHVDVVCRKVSRLTGFVIRISRHMHFRALLYLFKALITPHLTYCAVVWKPCQTDLLDRLDKCQRKISKVLMYRNKSCSSDLSYELRLSAFGLIKTCDLLDLLRLIFCFKPLMTIWDILSHDLNFLNVYTV